MYIHQRHFVALERNPTAWIVVEEKDGSSKNRGKHSVVQHASGVDTDEVEKSSTQKVQDDEQNIHPRIYANPVRVAQSTRCRDVDQKT